MNKLIIEIRQNENRPKSENIHVPYSASEIVQSALDAHDEGAAIAHFHPRDEVGHEDAKPEVTVEIVAGLRARSSMLVHPTLGRFEYGDNPLLRLSNVEALSARPSLTPELAPLDLASLNFDVWNPLTKEFVADNLVYQNTARDLRIMARRMRELGVKPQLVIYGLSGIRLMDALVGSGEIDTPTYASLVLSGEGMLFGHPATSQGLRAFIHNLSHDKVHWGVTVIGASYMPMLREILEAGGHVSIGLGDYAYPELSEPTNADLVREVVKIAREVGRDIASPEEARSMLGLKSPA